MRHGIYIHIPFCRSKCDYCSFYSIPVLDNSIIDSYIEAMGLKTHQTTISDNSIIDSSVKAMGLKTHQTTVSDNNIIESYVKALLREIDFITKSYKNTSAVDTVYFGGGTPSLLHPKQIMKILNFIRERFILESNPEITIEMNPNDLNYDKLSGYTDAGINRIVLGIQSLNNEMRENIGRRGDNIDIADIELFFSKKDYIKCIDIMAGLPGENKSILLNDLETITLYRPEHISLYLLSVDEDTPLGKRFYPDDDFESMQVALWRIAMDFLTERGYNHYEISNYALAGFEARHNSKYWDFTPYYGFGSGAHSFVSGKRYSNRMSISDYIKSAEFKYDIDIPNENNRIVEFVMTSLRRKIGFSSDEFKSVTSIPIPQSIILELNRLISEDMINHENERYFLSKNGIYYADSIIYRLTEKYL
ncbi:MAG: coproporphyrinogen III oxidase family protein [Leptospirales bacterium]|nr:coproporphyrinogen III oxidase family protein [Leptospirales bacterium]